MHSAQEAAAPAAYQADGVGVEEQGDGAALGGGFGIEDVVLTTSYFDARRIGFLSSK